MKKFKFSLQSVLNYREKMLEQEKNRLAELRAVLARLENELRELEAEHMERITVLDEKTREGIAVLDLVTHKQHIRHIENTMLRKTKDIEKALAAVEEQTQVVVVATMERDMVEKLREKHLERYRYEEARADELFIDEFVSSERSRSANA